MLYVSDLTNNRIWFLNRADGRLVGERGRMGENGGQFFGLHMIAVDSAGVVYTGEVFRGERVQRVVPAESGPVAAGVTRYAVTSNDLRAGALR